MSGRLGQLWLRHHGLDTLYMTREPQTLYYVVASSKHKYHMLDLESGAFVSFKKEKLDACAEKPTWFLKAQTWQPYWERLA